MHGSEQGHLPPPPESNPSIAMSRYPPPPFSDNGHAEVTRFLTENKWPQGLQSVAIKSAMKYPVRFILVDDSGSMAASDGHHNITAPNGRVRSVPCSRWVELADSLRFHATLAEKLGAPTEFRLLNGSHPIVVGRKNDNGANYKMFRALLDQSPSGATPLCRHIREITGQIRDMEPTLRQQDQKAVVVIATDGESSDGDIITALRPLQELPVWIVIKLCTDDVQVVNYWNNIDNELELEMDVLDDFVGEAREVYTHNPWLTYGLPLHQLREWGVQLEEMGLIDKKKLPPDDMRRLLIVLFGVSPENDLPQTTDGRHFFGAVFNFNRKEIRTWDPITRREIRWIKENRLRRCYAKGLAACNIL